MVRAGGSWMEGREGRPEGEAREGGGNEGHVDEAETYQVQVGTRACVCVCMCVWVGDTRVGWKRRCTCGRQTGASRLLPRPVLPRGAAGAAASKARGRASLH